MEGWQSPGDDVQHRGLSDESRDRLAAMTKYSIQLRNPTSGLWETQQAITPAYKYSTMRMRHHLFFHTVIGVVANLTAAEKAAHKLAIRAAKKFYWRIPCRVQRLSMWNGVELKDVVWQNGRAILAEKIVAAK